MIKIDNDIYSGNSLLVHFNSRDYCAYSKIYTLLYKSLYFYAFSLYQNTNVDSEDIIQDIFLEIWENKRLKFETSEKIKSYIFVTSNVYDRCL